MIGSRTLYVGTMPCVFSTRRLKFRAALGLENVASRRSNVHIGPGVTTVLVQSTEVQSTDSGAKERCGVSRLGYLLPLVTTWMTEEGIKSSKSRARLPELPMAGLNHHNERGVVPGRVH